MLRDHLEIPTHISSRVINGASNQRNVGQSECLLGRHQITGKLKLIKTSSNKCAFNAFVDEDVLQGSWLMFNMSDSVFSGPTLQLLCVS